MFWQIAISVLVVVVIVGVAAGPWLLKKVQGIKPTAPTQDAGVDVGLLAQQLNAVIVHCRKIKDADALKVLDSVAASIFHEAEKQDGEKKLDTPEVTK